MASAAVERCKRKLPERLAIVRADRSQRQFARDLGVFQQNVNRYESAAAVAPGPFSMRAVMVKIPMEGRLLGMGRLRRSG